MFRFLLVLWLMVPVGLIAWHLGPGRSHLSEDRAGRHLRAADRWEAEGHWHKAAAAYANARDVLGEDAVQARRHLRYAEAVALIKGGDRAAGQQRLDALLAEINPAPTESGTSENGDDADWVLSVLARNEIAVSAYYAAWHMRLDGVAPERWKSELETSQQHFRLLAEESARRAISPTSQRNASAHRQARLFQRNLEAAVKLDQVALIALAEWPLPKHFPDRKHALKRKHAVEKKFPLYESERMRSKMKQPNRTKGRR